MFSSFAPVIINMATRGPHLTINTNMGCNKLHAQTSGGGQAFFW